MSCPTCDHTMHRIGCQLTECLGSYFCPRCGTIRLEGEVTVPALVDCCRKLAAKYPPQTDVGRLLHSLGITESINRPEGRPA